MLRNKAYCCRLAESCAYDWSVVCKQRWRLLNSFSVGRYRLPLSVWAFCTAKTRKGLENEILQHESVVSDNPVISCVFVTVPLSLFPFAACFGVCFFMGHTRCPKDYGIPQGLCIGKISGFPRVSGLQLQTCLLHPLRPPCVFFNLPGGRASLTANHKR